MTPLFFGRSEAPLYGVYQPPLAADRHAGVVLCYPFGQEYMRAHRAFRQLAQMLARQGFHVFRFDYRGTGDASGDMTGVVLADWVEDVGEAIQELRDSTGVRKLTLVGLRLGALVAALASQQQPRLDGLVLWDPVIAGAGYDAELLAEIASRFEQESEYSLDARSGTALCEDGSLVFNGFPVPLPFRQSWETADLLALPPPPVARLLQVVSHEQAAFTRLQQYYQTVPGFSYQHVPAPGDWNYVDNFGSILLPQPVLQAIADWMVA